MAEGWRSSSAITAGAFQAHYNITKGIRLIAEGINLTNEPIEQYAGGAIARRVVYTTSGRTFTFGVSAEF